MTTRRTFLQTTALGIAGSAVAQTIASVKQAALTTEEKQQILFGNGRRLMEAKGVKI